MDSGLRYRPILSSATRNRGWNSLLYISLFLGTVALAMAIYRDGVGLSELTPDQIVLSELPGSLALSFTRMFISFLASLFLAFLLGVPAARTKWGERLIIPCLDILQSIPIVGFFPAAIGFFITISQGHRIGIEMAAVFLIMTSMTWNLAFAVYEAIRGIPESNLDAIMSFGVKGSARFWKLFAPASVPRLVYNSILSWSNGWFYLVACEIIAVGPMRYDLPGIGSFLAQSAEQDQLYFVFCGLLALTVLILFLDFAVWRPISVWSERFRHEKGADRDEEELHFFKIPFSAPPAFRQAARKIAWVLLQPFHWLFGLVVLPCTNALDRLQHTYGDRWLAFQSRVAPLFGKLLILFFVALAALALRSIYLWLQPPWPEFFAEIPSAILLSTGRLLLALLISLLWVIPTVLWVWNRPRMRVWLTTVSQVGASLPAIALFPLIIVIAGKRLGMETATLILLVMGTQWYLLFNCLGGISTIPGDLIQASRSLGLKNYHLWRRLVLPAIRPALVTGAITAWGAGWNAVVVAEYVSFKGETLKVKGIGSLLNHSVYQLGDNRAIAICIAALVAWTLLINLLVWHPFYRVTLERYRFE